MERTVILIKPDAVKRGAIGKIIARFEDEGFVLIAAKFLKLPFLDFFDSLPSYAKFGRICDISYVSVKNRDSQKYRY